MEARLHKNTLEEEADHILEEARVVVPGIQALIGFQLIAVLNQVFYDKLEPYEQWLHLIAICATIIAMVLALAPAAYHRNAEPELVSIQFVKLSTRLISWALIFLPLAICLDLYLIAKLITKNIGLSAAVTLVALGIFFWFWNLMPWLHRDKLQKHQASESTKSF